MNEELDYDTDIAARIRYIEASAWPGSARYLGIDLLVIKTLRYAGYNKIADAFENTKKCYD